MFTLKLLTPSGSHMLEHISITFVYHSVSINTPDQNSGTPVNGSAGRSGSQVFGKVRRGKPRNVGLPKPTSPGGRGGPATSIICAQAVNALTGE